jgi:type IV secretory pathway protease TraF
MSSDLTQLARRASLAVVLLVASVGAASAECAWVLWSESVLWEASRSAPVSAWRPLSGHASKAECLAAIITPSILGTGATLVVEYSCLPDTADPRGPNAK